MGVQRFAFSANAQFGVGGQGEFLRQMALALAPPVDATIYSRGTPAGRSTVVNLPFEGARRLRFDLVERLPVARSRRDWLTLQSDLDFDSRVAAAIDPPDLFDGVTAQCHDTAARLRSAKARVIVTCLNTHINHLERAFVEEHRRVGFRGRSFIHPTMRARALGEIAMAEHLRVNSHLAKRTFVDEGVAEDRVTVIHPGVDLDHFHVVPKQDDVFRVIAVSSIDPRKGVHYLLQAFEAARLPNAELLIIGGTGDRWSKRMLDGHMSRHSNIRLESVDVMTTEVARTLGRASVLVHAAVEEGFGLVIPQALACGRPVIATRTTGAAELIQEGVNGFVIEPRSVTELTERLRLLADDRDLWARLCQHSRPSVEAHGYARFARDVMAMYRKVLGDDAAGR